MVGTHASISSIWMDQAHNSYSYSCLNNLGNLRNGEVFPMIARMSDGDTKRIRVHLEVFLMTSWRCLRPS